MSRWMELEIAINKGSKVSVPKLIKSVYPCAEGDVTQKDSYHEAFDLWYVSLSEEGCYNFKRIEDILSLAKVIDKHVNITIQINSLFVY